MANSADLDQLASSEANWSGSTLFAEQGISWFSRTRVNVEDVPLGNDYLFKSHNRNLNDFSPGLDDL